MIDWDDNVRRFNVLGLWHATNYLKGISTVKDPIESARDVVQQSWLTLWRRQKFTKGLFITTVLGLASNAARDSRPIEIRRVADQRGHAANGRRSQTRVTDAFPVQIFGGLLCEETKLDDIESPHCGDE